MVLPQTIKIHIAILFSNSMSNDPYEKILNVRKLLTILKTAVKLNNEWDLYKKLLTDCTLVVEEAKAEMVDDESNWGHATWLCDKVIDKVSILVYDSYGDLDAITFGTKHYEGDNNK